MSCGIWIYAHDIVVHSDWEDMCCMTWGGCNLDVVINPGEMD